ncbi:hypothetical protein BCV72DRAFT_265066 [Rhizopus microsporus var. microsporus]|uniref:Uncharacterized protein n=2 Tax=Rhizopus microsporus TaxID=58291 RepID=A0A2G4SJ64_RHIZD|nr:uncharacterized protein RHIMIDRAFT_315885 [Rhizopus microsporus ATCC 52813]ORE02674.1 hypothetical protein BCV72DRAFT_265066 [Rhizopus microsporus var. microsporus]PHZ08803.1 hypothetical protein RHIMIDRAFT_315885 [Rhizopus microsporus ATCC 52813]
MSNTNRYVGDTVSADCRNADLNYRLDLRVITDTEKGPIEATTGEFASTKAITEGKLYNDKLRSVLAFKCHLNSLLKKLLYLPQSQASEVHMPILQIMGQNISLCVLSLIDKQVYSVQNTLDAEYPRTLAGIKTEGIRKIIDLLGQVEYMMDGIEKNMKNYSHNTNSKMKGIIGKGKCIRQFETEAWTSSVQWDTYIFDE